MSIDAVAVHPDDEAPESLHPRTPVPGRPPHKPLTERQLQALNFIRAFIEKNGMPPTLREIGKSMGIRSTNGVNDHLRALERKDYLSVVGMKSRALRINEAIATGPRKPAAPAAKSAGAGPRKPAAPVLPTKEVLSVLGVVVVERAVIVRVMGRLARVRTFLPPAMHSHIDTSIADLRAALVGAG